MPAKNIEQLENELTEAENVKEFLNDNAEKLRRCIQNYSTATRK